MARKWVRINRLSVICLKASHSIKAICGRHEPKIKLLTVWVKFFERGTWHNQWRKVWVIGSLGEVLTTFPWSAPSFFCCAPPNRKTAFKGQTRQAGLHVPPALLIQRSPRAEPKQLWAAPTKPWPIQCQPKPRLELVWIMKSSQPASSLLFHCLAS